MRALLLAPLFALFASCSEEVATAAETEPLPDGAQAWSLAGDPLYPPPMTEEAAAERQTDLQQAQANFAAEPSLENAIWVGRRQAYLGQYRDAVATYTAAISDHPEAPELYRHRGHRHITLRNFDAAIADFERAAQLISGSDDAVEADGQPNVRNIPTSTLHFNIWYHLGLAYYLNGDFEQALRCYRSCIEVSTNPDALVATSHWLYMTLRRLDRDDEAAQVLEPINAGLDVIENGAYHNLLLMYRGERQPDELIGGEDSVQTATAAYGVGNWFLYNDDPERARQIFESIVAGEQWAAFGHIAAAADLQRSR